MLPLESPDRIRVAFDDHCLVAHAGLILPATLALPSACPNWSGCTWIWAMLLAGPTLETD